MKPVTLDDYKRRLLRVLVFIQQNLDRDLSLEELAAIAHFSPYHFHRIFRGMVGESVQAHIRRIRLERAAMRLRSSVTPITAVAFEAGYETHESFTRAFRGMTGQSPSQFRQQSQHWRAESGAEHVHYSPHNPPQNFNPRDTGGATMDVDLKHLDPMTVAFVRHIGPYNECGKAWDALLPALGAGGLLGSDTVFIGICYDDPDITPPDKVRYDACVTVDSDFEPAGAIGVQTISSGTYAVTTHHGPYHTLGETYLQLFGEWIPRSGRALRSAPCLEIYLNDPESTEPEELLTDIYAPLEPA